MSTFDPDAVAKIINSKAAAGGLDEASVIEIEIRFEPHQSTFDMSLHRSDFDRVVQVVSVYGGAVLTVEGHSDVLYYLKRRAGKATTAELKTIRQSAKNLSLSRANAVRDALIAHGEASGITLDKNQFVSVGHGIDNPSTGVENGEPIAPKDEEAWKSNMRVVFHVVPIESEATAFSPVQ
jgi:outer membrane protein OmpA-like peptidoglycan-associated protein